MLLFPQGSLRHQCTGLHLTAGSPVLILMWAHCSAVSGVTWSVPEHELYPLVWPPGQFPECFSLHGNNYVSVRKVLSHLQDTKEKLKHSHLSYHFWNAAQKFAVTDSTQKEMTWRSNKWQSVFDTAGCDGVLGTGAVGAPLEGTAFWFLLPISMIFFLNIVQGLGFASYDGALAPLVERRYAQKYFFFWGPCMAPWDDQVLWEVNEGLLAICCLAHKAGKCEVFHSHVPKLKVLQEQKNSGVHLNCAVSCMGLKNLEGPWGKFSVQVLCMILQNREDSRFLSCSLSKIQRREFITRLENL